MKATPLTWLASGVATGALLVLLIWFSIVGLYSLISGSGSATTQIAEGTTPSVESDVANNTPPNNSNPSSESSDSSDSVSPLLEKPQASLSKEFSYTFHEFDRETRKKMQEISLALSNFYDSNKSFPHPELKGTENFHPQLSWRVRILPQLGENKLYSRFKLDEPWDSPNNLPLANEMPAIFAEPGSAKLSGSEAGKTNYQLITGPETLFAPNTRATYSQCKDGVTHTLLLVRTGNDKSVIWTQPQDVPFLRSEPWKPFGDLSKTGLLTFTVSGDFIKIDPKSSPDELIAMTTAAGGDRSKASRYLVRNTVANAPDELPIDNLRMEFCKTIVVGFLNFESSYRRYPPGMNRQNARDLNLSWRVHILPFIDEQVLYSKFRLDEPWDSEHNLTLLPEIPQVYLDPRDPEGVTTTRVLAFTNDTKFPVFGKEKRSSVTDGSFQTLAFAVAKKDMSVPWTKPDDVVPSGDDLITAFDLSPISKVTVAFLDGRVEQVPGNIAQEKLYDWADPVNNSTQNNP